MTSRTYPRWISEGFAEFYAGVKFADDGGLTLGIPPTFRGQEYLYAKKVPIRRLLDYDGGYSDYSDEFNAFYVQSWALFHYLRFDPARKGQLRTFETLLNEGVSAVESAGRAFGDLDRLATEVEAYVRRRRLPIATIPPGALVVSPIELRQLRPGEAAMMPVVVAARVGVGTESAGKLVPTARAVAQRYPEDPAVLAALAEIELAAGFDDAAIAAAERALASDANNVIAYIQKGHALAHEAEAAGATPEAWKEVRQQFLKANRVENDHPIPLVGYYLAYLKEGRAAPQNAVEGLEWAMQLAPFDPRLRWLVAEQMVREERWQEAARALSPLAYSPHRGEYAQRALALLQEVEAKAAAQVSATAATGQ
jgi:tetratricopeptide (TPR) repeat protein